MKHMEKYRRKQLLSCPKTVFMADGILNEELLYIGNIIPMTDQSGNRFNGKVINSQKTMLKWISIIHWQAKPYILKEKLWMCGMLHTKNLNMDIYINQAIVVVVVAIVKNLLVKVDLVVVILQKIMLVNVGVDVNKNYKTH